MAQAIQEFRDSYRAEQQSGPPPDLRSSLQAAIDLGWPEDAEKIYAAIIRSDPLDQYPIEIEVAIEALTDIFGAVAELRTGVKETHKEPEDAEILRRAALLANVPRHAENRAAKDDAIEYYRQHAAEFKSKNAAAEYISMHVVPYPFPTVRDWLKGI